MKKLIAIAAVAAISAVTSFLSFAGQGTKDDMYAFFAWKMMSTTMKGEVKSLTMIKDTHAIQIEYFNGTNVVVVVPLTNK